VFSALEVFYENALYKFTFDTDIGVRFFSVNIRYQRQIEDLKLSNSLL